MTALNQKFSMVAGDTKNIVTQVKTQNGVPLNATTVKWVAREVGKSDNIISKQTPSITVSGNQITIKLVPSDTLNLKGVYYHECEVTDSQGNISTIFSGVMVVHKSLV